MTDTVSINSKSVKKISLHKSLLFYYRITFIPFIILYIGGIYLYFDEEYTLFGAIITPFILLTHIITLLFTHWSINFAVFVNYSKAKLTDKEVFVKVNPSEHHGSSEICLLQKSEEDQYFFFFQKRKYIFNSETQEFEKIYFPIDLEMKDYYSSTGFESREKYLSAFSIYGLNKFDIPLPAFADLYKEQALAPFFQFQLFCVTLWLLDEYWYFALFTALLLLFFEGTVVKSRLVNLKSLRDMATRPSSNILVFREKKWKSINSDNLVPGDICSLVRNSSNVVPCDVLVLSGNCVVNEAMLTGESTPHRKEPISNFNPKDKLDFNNHKISIVFGGTEIVQNTMGEKLENIKKPLDGGAIGYVLRTGFDTSQGKLMRTILFATERVTANTKESLLFILFLLIFAVFASGYVLMKGLEDDSRSKYKLLLHCTLIITSVVPPELPMELALAVNTSVLALIKLGIFCTEPFRIPFAGKVSIACFDKTGTLTSDDLTLKGISGLTEKKEILNPKENITQELEIIMAGCQELVFLDSKLMGDPMEMASLNAIDWIFTKSDVASSKKNPDRVRIVHRFGFNSTFKRMSSIGYVTHLNTTKVWAMAKGAPEIMKPFFSNLPDYYDDIFKYCSSKGHRVIALGYRQLEGFESLTEHEIKNTKREKIESDLIFAGFLAFNCPLKKDSKKAIKMLIDSSHTTVMITGDNPLTACKVAQDLKMIEDVLILTRNQDNNNLQWNSTTDEKISNFSDNLKDFNDLKKKFDFCIPGNTLDQFLNETKFGKKNLSKISIFARVSPYQKESILISLKEQGFTTLMCGDGTNDVGALKQSHVGIAILNREIETKKKIPVKKNINNPSPKVEIDPSTSSKLNQRKNKPKKEINNPIQPKRPPRTMNEFMAEMESEMQTPQVKLGDASIASPFTSKGKSVLPVTDIIRQGRCTLVATHQMFKILGLNCLISAYSLSVLYLDGIKWGDSQATIVGMLVAFCFLFISKSQPLQKLSKEKPQESIFSFYMFFSIIGQFIIHLICLMLTVDLAKSYIGELNIEPDSDFEPNLLNSAVFVISCSMQVSTFAVNYKGHPFMQGLTENRPFLYALLFVGGIALACATEVSLEFNESLELVPFPDSEFSNALTKLLLQDFFGAILYEAIVKKIFL